MKLSKISIPESTMCVEIVSDNSSNHMVYFLDENADVIESIHIAEATIGEVVSVIGHMVIICLRPHNVFDMMCGYKIRAGHIFEPDFYPYDHIAWRYFLNKELLYIVREFAKLNNVEKYELSDEYQEKKHRIIDYIYSKPTPIEKENESVHQRMIEARRYELGALQNWIL